MFNIRFNTSFTWSSYVAYGRVDQSTWMLTWDVDISFHRWCDQGSVISPCLMLICGIYKIDRCSLFLLFHIFSNIIFKYTHCIYSRGLKHWVILWLFCSWLLLKFVLCYSVFIIDCFLLLSRCGTHSPFKKMDMKIEEMLLVDNAVRHTELMVFSFWFCLTRAFINCDISIDVLYSYIQQSVWSL